LVRWQIQDADAAQLRDQLRQAARTWDEHGRSADLLWSGTAFREYRLWRERYPGGLTDTEEAFGQAMTRHAERRRRRRRVAVAASFGVLLAVLAIVGGFWRRSISEARRAEAANLFSVAQLKLLDERLTAAVAYAAASLELADNPEVRRLALEALQRRPAVISLPGSSPYWVDFSPDGRWLVTADPSGGAKLWPSDGGPATVLEGCDVAMEAVFSPRGDLVAASMDTERRTMGLWSVPEGRLLHSFSTGEQGETMFFRFSGDGRSLITSTESKSSESSELELRSWPVAGGEPDPVGRLVLPAESKTVWPALDSVGSRLAWAEGRRVRIAGLEGTTLDLATAISIENDENVAAQVFDEQGRQLAISDSTGKIRIWSLESDPPALTHTLTGGGGLAAVTLMFDPSGSMLATGSGLWDLTAPPDSEPTEVLVGWGVAFHPSGKWIATSGRRVALWPLARTYPRVLRGHEDRIRGLAFTPDAKRLVSSSLDGSIRVWPLEDGAGERHLILHQAEGNFAFPGWPAMAPDGSFVVSGNNVGQVFVHSLDGQLIRELNGFKDGVGVAVGPGSRLVAAGAGGYDPKEAFVRVWDLESREVRILDAADGLAVNRLDFSPNGDLWVWSGWSGSVLRRWHLAEGQPRIVEEVDLSNRGFADFDLYDFALESGRLLLRNEGRIWIHDLDANQSHELASHSGPNSGGFCGFDSSRELVISSDFIGTVRVGPVTGEEPHLLTGHGRGYVGVVAVSPDGRWIATGSNDGTIRLWPMPDFSKPPLHTLPRDELIAKLKTLTNFRTVRDPTSSLGWEIEFAPFPGWETVPEW
jgi:WD40 repeat protein